MNKPSPISGFHAVGVIVLSFLVGLLFLREPGVGDEMTYWTLAFELHDEGGSAWSVQSFHDLRWPVWAVCWVLQFVFGPGLISYYACPWLWAALGALVAFSLGRKVGGPALGWTAAIAFLFHPLLDLVIYRPMPDLSEAVLGGCAVLCWLGAMRADRAGIAWVFSLLTGLAIAVAHSNRLTGVFIIPVLLVGTLLFFRRRFHWLLACGLFAAVFVGIECLIYKQITGDFLHSLHANLSARGRKGTESVPLWYLPFRFLDSLWKGNRIAPVYCLLALLGGWAAWRKGGVVGRVAVAWFAVLYLEYSCALQSISPPRPLIRDAERFLCGLAVPMSVLVAFGLAEIWAWLRVLAPAEGAGVWLSRKPLLGALLGIGVLSAATSRERFDRGFVPEFRAHLDSVPAGQRIFTHTAMRGICFLVNAEASRKFEWFFETKILDSKPSLEKLARQSDQFWYCRKLVWLTPRKELERKKRTKPPRLASYFSDPPQQWYLAKVVAKGDTPDFVFYRKRTAGDPAPIVLTPESTELKSLVSALPVEWNRETGQREMRLTWQVPASLRGRTVHVATEGFSDEVEAVSVSADFTGGNGSLANYVLKPYFHASTYKDFFAFVIPANAEQCLLRVRFNKAAQKLTIENLVLTHEQ